MSNELIYLCPLPNQPIIFLPTLFYPLLFCLVSMMPIPMNSSSF